MFGYDSVGDMFDGGGAGRSGSTFSGGGPISSISNMVATPSGSRGSEGQMRPQGRPDMQRMAAGQSQKPNFLQDMFNGGGMGASGDTFQGAGGYSGLLNMLGIKPAGAQDRSTMQSYADALQAASQPTMQPQAPFTPQMQPQPAMQPPTASYGAPSPVSTYPLSDFGDLWRRIQERGVQPGYLAQPYVGAR